MVRRYSEELKNKVSEIIPSNVLLALAAKGWCAFGVYEAIEEAIKQVKQKGSKPFRGANRRNSVR